MKKILKRLGKTFYHTQGDVHTQYGVIKEGDLTGNRAVSNTGKEFIVFDAKFVDSLKKIKRGAATMHLKDIGTIENIGVSIYNSYQLDYILSNLNVDIVQLPVSILDQRLINKGYLSILKDRGIEVHARSVFLQGLLLMNNSDVPGYFKPISNKLNQFNDECEKLLLKPLDLALSFVYSLKDVDKIVIGVESLHQLKQIVSAINNKVDTCKYEFLSINDSKYVNPSKWKY